MYLTISGNNIEIGIISDLVNIFTDLNSYEEEILINEIKKLIKATEEARK
jgi:hypothetical protein